MKTNRLPLWLNFMLHSFTSPRSAGTLVPSLSYLGRAMAKKVPQGNGYVVELGAGTGSITKELIKYIEPERLIIIERVPWMVRRLRAQFPHLNIIEADATQLLECIPANSKVDCVVSSLPLVSLPRKIKDSIVKQLSEILLDGTLVQFTYYMNPNSSLTKGDFICLSRHRVWRNLPPATVLELVPNINRQQNFH